MPFVKVDQEKLYYRIDGGPDRPVLVLGHSLGADHGLWDPQLPALLPHFQIVRIDWRGHGASDATPGDYTIEQLGGDLLAVADAAGAGRFAYCGLSLGGMVGLWLAAKAPDRVTHLVAANTTPKLTDPGIFEARRRTVLGEGMAAVTESALERSFSSSVLKLQPPYVGSIRHSFLGTNPVGYAGCCAAIRDNDQTALLARIRTPTLVIGGSRDVPMPWEAHGQVMVDGIPGAAAKVLNAAHLSNLEQPSSFNAALLEFLLPAAGPDTLSAGFTIRRTMLGDEYVDKAIAGTTDLNREFQELITRYAWGAVWTRPGLPPRIRRLLVLAITASMGRWEEFRLHVKTGLRNELEMCDLKEALLQVAVYSGAPAANTALHIAAEEAKNAAAAP
jgi:3-oxoadipate enol-lactonase/4-carboxymuconolactone decarboxylase